MRLADEDGCILVCAVLLLQQSQRRTVRRNALKVLLETILLRLYHGTDRILLILFLALVIIALFILIESAPSLLNTICPLIW